MHAVSELRIAYLTAIGSHQASSHERPSRMAHLDAWGHGKWTKWVLTDPPTTQYRDCVLVNVWSGEMSHQRWRSTPATSPSFEVAELRIFAHDADTIATKFGRKRRRDRAPSRKS